MTDTLNTFINILFGKGFGIATIFTVMLWIYIWHRSGSPFLLLRRLLARFMGVESDTSTKLGRFFHEHAQLMAFRMQVGMKEVRTVGHAMQVVEWAERHDLNIEEVAACGGFFDFDKIRLRDKLPPVWVAVGSTLFASAFLAFALLSVPFSFLDSVGVRANETSHWFLLAKTYVKPMIGSRVPLSECQNNAANIARVHGISDKDSEIICKFAADPQYASFVDQGIHDQHIVFPVATGFFAFAFCMFYQSSKRMRAAQKIRDWLKLREDKA